MKIKTWSVLFTLVSAALDNAWLIVCAQHFAKEMKFLKQNDESVVCVNSYSGDA